MKALELRYKYDARDGKETIKFVHTTFEHSLGDELFTKVHPTSTSMTIIAREPNMTEAGFNLVVAMYNAGKRRLAKHPFEMKVKLALHIVNQIGKLTPEEQNQAYQHHTNQINARREARLDAAAHQAIRCLMTM